jgi:hypothetical protein
MHNTLIAAGPDFRKGWEDETPSGNIDLAPTVLWILGVPQATPMDGRVLLEAMPGHKLGGQVSQEVLRAENPETGWKQYLKVSRVGTTEYFDEGNRERVSAKVAVAGIAQAGDDVGVGVQLRVDGGGEDGDIGMRAAKLLEARGTTYQADVTQVAGAAFLQLGDGAGGAPAGGEHGIDDEDLGGTEVGGKLEVVTLRAMGLSFRYMPMWPTLALERTCSMPSTKLRPARRMGAMMTGRASAAPA